MGLARSAILWAADNRTLRTRLPRLRFVRRAVSRFMPGETLDDALAAAETLGARGVPTTFTALGENVTTVEEVDAVRDHYLEAFDRIAEHGLDTEISVKPTHLGLDIDAEVCDANLARLARRAAERGTWLWLDMEASAYVEATVEAYRRLRRENANVGICLQAYLRRTAGDVESLLPLDPSIRLVKGAYREPESVVFRSKAVIDESFRRSAARILDGRGEGGRLALGTHDVELIRRIESDALARGSARESFEVHMLFGIRADDLRAMARDGYRVRSLIAYGTYWYPWFMRRIAEKPVENTLLALRNLFG